MDKITIDYKVILSSKFIYDNNLLINIKSLVVGKLIGI
jgi:hypothetical protein